MLFKKSKKTKNNIFNLKIGNQIEADLKIWTIKNCYEYEWDDSKSIEYELDAFGETAFLNIEDDDGKLFITLVKETSEPVESIAYYIASGEKVPKKIEYKKEKYKLDEVSEGVCKDKNTGKTENIVSYDYFNKNEDKTISYEQGADNELTAYFGNVIYEHEIQILDNKDGANRFA